MQSFEKSYKLNGVPFGIEVSEFREIHSEISVRIECYIPSYEYWNKFETNDFKQISILVKKCEQICRNIILNKFEHLEYSMSNMGFVKQKN